MRSKLPNSRPNPKPTRSVWSASIQHPHEFLEQVEAVLRAGAGFGVVLDTEGAFAGDGYAAIGAVEERDVGFLDARRQRGVVDREAVVHAGYLDRAVLQPLHR